MADEKKPRGRPPKKATPEQLETLSKFCSYIRSDYGSGMVAKRITTGMKDLERIAEELSANGMYDPIFSQTLEQAIGFTSGPATNEELQEWLKHPEIYSDNLRFLSQYLENAALQYGRAASLLSDIKSYHYDLRCATPNLGEKVNTEEFKNSYSKALRTLRKLNIPYQIRKLDAKVAKDGVAFVWFNKTVDTIDLLELPSDFCYITAPWTYGYLFAIDLSYFDRFAFQQTQVPELWEAYQECCRKRQELAKSGRSKEKLIPYQYYPVSPFEGWCAVFDINRPLKIPPMIGGAGAAIDSLGYRELIKQKAVIDLYKVLSYKIPINKTTNKMDITYKEASNYIDAMRSVFPENFIVTASPFDLQQSVSADQTSVMEGLEEISDKTFYDYTGMPQALFNSDIKSAAALKLATNTTFAYASSGLYASMQNLVNWILRTECGSRYDWHIVFHGNKLYEDEEQQRAVSLLQSANAPVSYVMSTLGFEPFDIQNAFEIENMTGIKDKMKPLQAGSSTSFTSDGGRPSKLDSMRSDSADANDDSGNED